MQPLHKTLTATHDNILSWAGVGSALTSLYNQLSVPASVFGTLHIAGYLGCVTMLHITIPAILSVETFNTTAAVPASTFGIPEFANSTAVNSTSAFMATFSVDFLTWRGIFDDSPMIGLFNDSLYEVLQKTRSGKGEAQISALGFNVDVVKDPTSEAGLELTVNGVSAWLSSSSRIFSPNALLVFDGFRAELGGLNNSIYISTTSIVVDSEDHQGSPLILRDQPLSTLKDLTEFNLNISQIQVLQCSKSLVAQSGTIDMQSNTLISGSLYPNLYKNNSTWVAAANLDFSPQDSTLMGSDLWSEILGQNVGIGMRILTWSAVDEYLMSYLGLDPFANSTSQPVVLKLHDIENALSNLLALVFWIAGHVKVDPWYLKYSQSADVESVTTEGTVPVLVSGTATIIQQEPSLYVRLNSNIIAVALGLATSVVQMILCTKFLGKSTRDERSTKGVGLLHNIWLWRNHLQISNPLKDIRQPTETKLRATGLIPFQRLKDIDNCKSKEFWNEGKSTYKSSSSLSGTNYGSFSQTAQTGNLQIMCILLHILLVAAYLTLLGVAKARKEHHIVFSIDGQQTIYYSALVYLTQRMAIAYAIRKYSLLTATHDKILAWNGIGSAVSMLFQQFKLPVSSLGIFSICLYLSTISALHVTTSALVSVEAFNYNNSTTVDTHGIPQWSDSAHNLTLQFLRNNGALLPWIGHLDGLQTLGLYNGSLYDVMFEAYPGSAGAEVQAVGFDITCGYIPGVTGKEDGGPPFYDISFPTESLNWKSWESIPNPDTILIASIAMLEEELPTDSIILYTQNSVSDSSGIIGPSVTLPGLNISLQFLQCSKSLVSQTGQVDESRQIIPNSLSPSIYKHNSTWQAYNPISKSNTQDYGSMLQGNSVLTHFANTGVLFIPMGRGIDWGSMYLMQQLGLDPVVDLDASIIGSTLDSATIQALESGGLDLLDGQDRYLHFKLQVNILPQLAMQDLEKSLNMGPIHVPILSMGNTTIEVGIFAARLDVSIGLGASIVLLILVLSFSAGMGRSNPCVNSMGFLQAIWVFEHHPELSAILEQVGDPTDYNLRVAGLVKVRLLDALSLQENED
ncbi:hypothetical protein B0H19DRAFT_1084493 [Mycena capillaripes]|nr:hypothetical protein B0H19DRAFT_1084493 [Mycena capillaripes]